MTKTTFFFGVLALASQQSIRAFSPIVLPNRGSSFLSLPLAKSYGNHHSAVQELYANVACNNHHQEEDNAVTNRNSLESALVENFSRGVMSLAIATALVLSPIARTNAVEPLHGTVSSSDVMTTMRNSATNILMSQSEDVAVAQLPPEIKTKSTGRTLDLADQMAKEDVRFYGAYWCSHCASQKDLFGKEAFAKINYVECSDLGKNSQSDLCDEKDISGFPTWEIHGKFFAGERGLDELEKLVQGTTMEEEMVMAPPPITATSSERTLALAKDLELLNGRMYGAYWCPFCSSQKESLGKEAFERIPYVECTKEGINSQTSLCIEKSVLSVPTWEINGELYRGSLDVEELEEIVRIQKLSTEKAPAKLAAAKSTSVTMATTEAIAEEAPAKADEPSTATKEEMKDQDASALEASPMSDETAESSAPPKILARSSKRAQKLADDMKALNVRMYGAYWCSHCQAQKEVLGKDAFEKVTYIECAEDGKDSQPDLCDAKEIQSVPAWEIGGRMYTGEKTMDELEKLIADAKPSNFKEAKVEEEKAPLVATPEKVIADVKPSNVEEAKMEEEKAPLVATPLPSVVSSTESSTVAPEKEKEDQSSLSIALASNSEKLEEPSSADAKEKEVEPTSPPAIKSKSSKRALALAEKMKDLNIRMYGAYWCPNCQAQKEIFGKEAFQIIPYVECAEDGKDSEPELCDAKEIHGIPTWEIGGRLYSGEKTLEEMEKIIADTKFLEPQLAPIETKTKAPSIVTTKSSEKAIAVAGQLEKLNTKIYGAYWCPYTKDQREKLGKEALSKIEYVECSKDGENSVPTLCKEKGVPGYPTWEIDGKLYAGDQDVEDLEEIISNVAK